MADASDMDRREQEVRIDRMIAEARKFAAEQNKLAAEASKFSRERGLAPGQIVLSAMTTGAALFGAGAAFIKLIG